MNSYFELLRYKPVVTVEQIVEFRELALEIAKRLDVATEGLK